MYTNCLNNSNNNNNNNRLAEAMGNRLVSELKDVARDCTALLNSMKKNHTYCSECHKECNVTKVLSHDCYLNKRCSYECVQECAVEVSECCMAKLETPEENTEYFLDQMEEQ